MNSFTFQITVTEDESRIESGTPMDADKMRDYLWTLIASGGKMKILNIVRDY